MILVVARSLESAALFTARHPHLAGQIASQLGETSYFALLNRLIETGAAPVCVVHDDVTLGADFVHRLARLVARLDADWPAWGLAGNAGVLSFRIGFEPSAMLRYLADPHGGPNMQGHILPVQCVDGNVMLLNPPALRARAVRLPDWSGFQLYDFVLSLETLRAGLAVLAAPELACWHGSGGSQAAFDAAAKSDAFLARLGRTVANRSVMTLNGAVWPPLSPEDFGRPGRLDVDLESLRCPCAARPARTVAICVRTRFDRPALLRRTLESIGAFRAAAGSFTRFAAYVITDAPALAPDWVDAYAAVLAMPLAGDADSRNLLVRHAARTVDADWLWFVDDDDWLFPNEAERLGLLMCVLPREAAVFLDTQHFHESLAAAGPVIGAGYQSRAGRYFPAADFARSLQGINHIPFCGMLISAAVLKAIPDAVYESVIYYEDLSILLAALLSDDVVPVVVDTLYAGISLRTSGNSVTEPDRTKWNVSMSNLVAAMTCGMRAGPMLTVPMLAAKHGTAEMLADATVIEPLRYLSNGERTMVHGLRVMRTVVRVATKPTLWWRRGRTVGRLLRRDGLGGVLRWMTLLGRSRHPVE